MNDIIPTPSGGTLLVAATTPGKVYAINPITGASKEVAGIDVPSVVSLVLGWLVARFAAGGGGRREVRGVELATLITANP